MQHYNLPCLRGDAPDAPLSRVGPVDRTAAAGYDTIMLPLSITTSRLAADVLRIALAARGVPVDTVRLHVPAADEEERKPAAVCLQPGGLRAFRRMGLDLDAQGTVITGLQLLHPRGHRAARLDLTFLSTACPMLFIATDVLRRVLAAAAQARSPSAPATPPPAPDPWPSNGTCRPCPGVLQQVFRGRLRDPQDLILWDHPRAYVGVGQLSDDRVVLYTASVLAAPAPLQRDAGRRVLEESVERLADRIQALDGLVDERWFPLPEAGSRPCWDGSGLRWSSAALRLHPVSGMAISYWALQANHLADALARHGRPSAHFIRALDARNRRMVRRNLLSISFHLRPTWLRRTAYWPAVWLLARWAGLRRAVIWCLWLC